MTLENGGWLKIEDLLATCRCNNFPITREELEEVVRKNDKQRFSFDENGEKIRANQGHSVEVDLHLERKIPPAKLFHGTARRNIDMIKEHGVLKMSRHHVHLSADAETARKVGARHGKPVIFEIDAAAMSESGYHFFVSANGV